LGPGKKAKWLQEATVQSPWTTNGTVEHLQETRALEVKIVFKVFALCVKVHNNIFLVYKKNNAFSYMVTHCHFVGLSLYMI